MLVHPLKIPSHFLFSIRNLLKSAVIGSIFGSVSIIQNAGVHHGTHLRRLLHLYDRVQEEPHQRTPGGGDATGGGAQSQSPSVLYGVNPEVFESLVEELADRDLLEVDRRRLTRKDTAIEVDVDQI
jgi:hypothetical protein